jgi:hypothetical protein
MFVAFSVSSSSAAAHDVVVVPRIRIRVSKNNLTFASTCDYSCILSFTYYVLDSELARKAFLSILYNDNVSSGKRYRYLILIGHEDDSETNP